MTREDWFVGLFVMACGALAGVAGTLVILRIAGLL